MEESLNPENSFDKKRTRGLDADMIIKLPDSLLQHILSFVSIKDAVRTSLLSRKWKYVWMLVPSLELYTEKFSGKNDLCKFIDRFVYLRGNSLLQKFIVRYNLSVRPSLRLKSWIDAAIVWKVQHLEVGYCFGDDQSDDRIETSQSFFICNTLVVLKLDDVFFLDVPKKVSLSNLKIMHLHKVIYANDSAFNSLIYGCPVLEELSISRPSKDNLTVLYVCSRTLKLLSIKVFNFYDYKKQRVVIDAPNLENLSLADELSESFLVTKIGSPSLKVGLDVDFNRDYRDELDPEDFSFGSSMSRLLYTGISTARSMTISLKTFEYRRFGAVSQFHNLIHLEATVSRPACKVLLAVLEFSPNLKSLVLELDDEDTAENHPVRLAPAAPLLMFLSLESITLKSPVFGESIEMRMIKYFLRKPVLKEMKVYLCMLSDLEEEFRILKRILTIPRRSTACQVYIKQARFNFT